MPLAVLIPLILQYGPAAIVAIEQLVAALKPLFEGRTPTEAEIEGVFAAHAQASARLQATT